MLFLGDIHKTKTDFLHDKEKGKNHLQWPEVNPESKEMRQKLDLNKIIDTKAQGILR